MGIVDTIGAQAFPRQGPYIGARVRVMFHYGPPIIMGTIVRDDAETPYCGIIRLDDGRYVLMTECQYAPVIK